MRRLVYQVITVFICLILFSCTTKKKKGDIGWLGKSYQNVTARFNGYYNADVILNESFVALETQHQDNYNQILDLYPYVSVDNPQAVSPELDRAIEKVTTVAALHEPSHWVDDCYVLMGKAQYLKQDYESAEETFAYFAESFDPNDPSSRVYKSAEKGKSDKEKRKAKLKEERKIREEERKAKEKTKKEEKEIKEKERAAKTEADKIARKERDAQKKADAEFKAQERKVDEAQKKEQKALKEADRKAQDEFKASQRKQLDRIKKEKLDTKKEFNKKEDKVQEEIRALKAELSKEQSEAREKEREWKQQDRKKKSDRSKKRKKGTKKEEDKSIDFSSQIKLIEDRILGQIETKEKSIESLKVQEEQKLEQLDQEIADLDKKEEIWKQEQAAKKEERAKKKEEEELAQAARKEERAKLKAEEAQRKKEQKALEEQKEEEQLIAEDDNAEEELDESPSEKKKKPTKVNTGGKGGFLKHKPVYSEGMLWLAKTHIERADYGSAEYLLNQLAENPNIRDKVAQEIPVAKAHLNIRQKRYDLALPALEQAIDLTKDKSSKARYAFIKAQIHEENNDPSAAYLAYDQASSYSRDYEMKINAQLSQIRSGWANGNLTKKEAAKKLNKLAKDNKNQEYLSQIYFTSAEINLADGDIAAAQDDFKKALDAGNTNKAQKAESFYRLANLFYLAENYISALNYYDSTLAVISVKDEKYFEVKKKSDNLKHIGRQLNIFYKQDSLLRLSTLSDEELRKIAVKILEEQKENDTEEAQLGHVDVPQNNNASPFNSNHNSNFFAYNKLVLDKGKQDFTRKWGDRKLQDNWRRSSELGDITDDEDVITNIVDNNSALSEDLTSGEINNVLKDVPRTDTQKESTNKKIENSLFELGSLYRTKIQNFNKSIETLQVLLRRYPNTPKKLDSYYLIYLDYLDMNENGLANEYKQKIITDFPESEYAMILTDPNYLKSRKSDQEMLEDHYGLTYSSFENSDYAQTIQMAEESVEKFGAKNAYRAKYDLIKTMAKGNALGKDAYIKELKDFTDRNKNTPEATRALEIMRFLKGDEEAFDSRLFEEDIEDFTVENDKLHYVLVVLYDVGQEEMNNAKITISDYNEKFFKLDKLRLNNLFLNSETKAQIILIRKFSNREKSMKYFEGVAKNKQDFLNEEETPFDIFAVTSRNYREIMKQKTVRNYRVFFENEYLNQ